MQDFAEQNCAIFDGAKEEHSLEQTDIHQRFKALFERLVEEYIESLGVSIGEFYRMVALAGVPFRRHVCSRRQRARPVRVLPRDDGRRARGRLRVEDAAPAKADSDTD